jgi:hypothetical protein
VAVLPDTIRAGRQRHGAHERAALARYVDRQGRGREVITQRGFQGSVLVVDRDAATRGDHRLVAHLCADEPPENAALVCASYLDQVRSNGCRCRPLTPADFDTSPLPGHEEAPLAREQSREAEPVDRGGNAYRLQLLWTGMSIPELRWRRHSPPPCSEQQTVSTREVIASLESYEPVRWLTINALAAARCERELSTAVLRAELTRVQLSPIVLNRGLREATLERMGREGLSLSEIATRCGRVKRDAAGKESGETSWLARRLGLLPEGGKDAPTPWIHSDVLALIARRGLGLSPREVEVE